MTSAPGDTISPAQLLHYLPTYRVLICLHCRYAIQPGAVMRHLKEIHSIKRIARQVFIDHVSKIELSQPNDVIAPDETHFPVPLLPIQTGLACTFVSCTHLCVTRKRMKQHWRSVHHIIASEEGNFWISVPLQTFFRGNALRYFTNPAFVVSPPRASSSDGLASDRNFLITSTHPQSIEWDDNTHLSGSDRALLDHYRKFTYKTLSCSPKTDNAFRVTVIKLASKFPFLHHGILACSALHLASSDPSNKEYYTIQSLQYQDQATPAFRWATMHVDSNNCQAVLAFAFFLVVCSLGSGFDDQGLFLSNDNEQDQVTDTDMPSLHWINILRNGCSMLCPVWDELTSGPLAPFAALWRDDIGVIVDSNDLLLRTLLSVFPEDGTTEYHIYHDSAVKLVAAFKFLQEHGPSPNIWDTLNSWPMRILPGYLDLLKQNRPSALLLLAYYAVLLRPLQGEWFLEGRITKLIDEIARRLEGRCSVRIWELFSEVRREYFS